jgi:hypothetical protein
MNRRQRVALIFLALGLALVAFGGCYLLGLWLGYIVGAINV